MSSFDMIVKRRLVEICPDESVDEKSIDELVKDCKVAFEIIGYKYYNLEKSVKKVSKSLETRNWDGHLATFIFNVWKVDK